ncbi:hypothetical protein BDR26DRAFT_858035 [Obelidium mucronatum]|nr:hypothetical protein BDR26DRAFT_858035 [Obelidium mucronatum]
MDFVFCDPVDATILVTYTMALQKLAEFYNISDIVGALNEVASVRKSQRPTWSEFGNKNKFGFLNGILTLSPDQNMRDDYASKIYWTLRTPSLPEPNSDQERRCLNLLYNRFIHPFKQYSKGSSNSTPHESPPSTPPGASSLALDSNAVNPCQSNFKAALMKRDKVCLFCWVNDPLDAAHLIAQKGGASIAPLVEDLLFRASLDNIYRVQNGIFLCKNCHTPFDGLRRYIEVVDGGLVAKVVNLTNDSQNEEWRKAVRDLRIGRAGREEDWPGRQAVDAAGDMYIYFDQNDANILPNQTALIFHKAACLIWKMAGAANDSSNEFLDDGDDGSVDGLLAKVSNRLRGLDGNNDRSSLTLGGLEDFE